MLYLPGTFLIEACPSYLHNDPAQFPSCQFRSIRGERYLIVGLIQTLIQIEFSARTPSSMPTLSIT